MSELFTALGLVLVLEGVFYALFPGAVRRFMAYALGESEGALRRIGLIAAIIGVTIVGLVRGFP